jgi:hypothetical protein
MTSNRCAGIEYFLGILETSHFIQRNRHGETPSSAWSKSQSRREAKGFSGDSRPCSRAWPRAIERLVALMHSQHENVALRAAEALGSRIWQPEARHYAWTTRSEPDSQVNSGHLCDATETGPPYSLAQAHASSVYLKSSGLVVGISCEKQMLWPSDFAGEIKKVLHDSRPLRFGRHCRNPR